MIWVSPLAFGLSHPPNYEIKMKMENFMDIVQRQQANSEEYWVNQVAYRKNDQWIATRRTDGFKVNLNGEPVEGQKERIHSPKMPKPKPSPHLEEGEETHSVVEDQDDRDEYANSMDEPSLQVPSIFELSEEKATVESKLGMHTTFYCQQCPTRTLVSLTSYYPHPDLFDECKESVFGANSFFIGSRGIRTTLHYDRPLVDNLFCQIHGKKRVRLFAPEEGVHFCPFSFESKYGHVSRIPEIDQVDHTAFPNFHKAKLAADVILDPGDALYIPKGWWHHVEHNHSGWDELNIADRDNLSISLNFWFY